MEKIFSYVGKRFESSCYRTEEYVAFERTFLNYLKKKFKEKDLEIVKTLKGHFECSLFAKNNTTGKFAYVSISDVRYDQDRWANRILYRTAEHEKDYRGGCNNYSSLEDLASNLVRITK